MIAKTFKIISENGISSRIATSLIKQANRFQSNIYLEYDNMQVNLKSVLGVLSVGIGKDSSVLLIVDGRDESEAFNIIEEYILKEKIATS